MTKQGMIDNARHIAGIAIGKLNRLTGIRYSKEQRGTRWFSTVAANLSAEGEKVNFLPYR